MIGARRGAAALQWLLLGGVSLLFVILLEAMDLPAALLIGPMAAGIACGVAGMTVRVGERGFTAAQAIIGCLIAGAIEPDFFVTFVADWPLLVSAALATLVASSLLGLLVARFGTLPGTTAVWGSAPGAASAMVVMADAFGADARLVAFMQYLRVMMVSASAALIARFWVEGNPRPAQPDWFGPLPLPDFPLTIAVAVVGVLGGRLLRLPAYGFMGPLVLATALHLAGLFTVALPQWLLAASFAVIGWAIGLRFTRQTVGHAARALPQVTGAILILIAVCAVIAWMLSTLAGIDLLTAFLATSPGGMESVAIIAAASAGVDMSFVMTLQMARFLIVLTIGPPLARFVARRAARRD
jgi:uncharacterized protein